MKARASRAVIEFPQGRVRPPAPREPGASSAEVVIFPGVRIERIAEEPAAAGNLRGGLGQKGRGQRR